MYNLCVNRNASKTLKKLNFLLIFVFVHFAEKMPKNSAYLLLFFKITANAISKKTA